MRLVPTSRSADGHALDLIGAVLSFVALTALVYGVIEGPHQGWTHSTTVIAFAVAAASAVLLLRFELRTPAPMLDPRLFRDPSLVGGTAAITSVFFAIFGMFFLVTQHLQYVGGHTPLEAGLRITPNALAVLIMSSQVPRLTTRFGSRRVMSAGFIAAAVGFVILATLNPSSSDWIVAAGLLGTGTGMALVMPGGSQHIMASVPAGKAGVGSALNDASREVGGALGIAVAGSIAMTAFRNSHAATAVARITRGAAPGSIGEALQRINHAAESGTINATARTALVSDVRMAFAHGTSIAFTTITALTAIAGLLAIRQLPKRSTPTTPNQQTSAGPETHQQEDINMQPAAIRHGDGDTYDVLGSTMTIKADADATGGAVEIAVVDTRHGADVPPHTHPWAETYLILDGELDVQIGPTRHHATKGDFLTVPSGTVHGFSVISDRASFLHVSIGSGAVDLFRDLDAAVPHIPSPDDVPTIVEIGGRHGARLAPAP